MQEMLYVWNGMTMLAGGAEYRDKHLKLLNEEMDNLEKKKEECGNDKTNNGTFFTSRHFSRYSVVDPIRYLIQDQRNLQNQSSTISMIIVCYSC